MRRFVLGTAGHVDHGKTTLVHALTGVDTDRLPEEKRRGITIELGFAPWDLGDGISVSLIDVPGHRRLVHTMIAGATGMELVLLVVAADEGVMPQTREHIAACELLGLTRAIVAVTKIDRAGEELGALAGEEARSLLGDRWSADVVLCSAKTGQGLDALKNAVKKALIALPAGTRASGPARLSVDRAFSVRGAGTVVTGTLVGGRIALGAPLRLVGESGAIDTQARGLHVHDRAVDLAEAPTRLAINLAGIGLDIVRRGDVLTSDASAIATKTIDVAFFPAAVAGAHAEAGLRRGTVASLHVGTARSTAKARPIVPKADATEEAGPEKTEKIEEAPQERRPTYARLRLAHPIVVFGGDRYVLRGADVDGPAGAVLGGGVVLDARAPRSRPKARRLAVLGALEKGEAKAALTALVAEAAPRPFVSEGLASRFQLPETAFARAADKLVQEGTIVRLKNGSLVLRSRLTQAAALARTLTAEHHEKAPLDRGIPLETLRRRLAETSSLEAAEEAIRMAARKGPSEPIVIEGDIARIVSIAEQGTSKAASGPLGKAIHALTTSGLRGLSEATMRETTGAQPKEVKAILAKLVRDGNAIHTGELWFLKTAVDDLRTRISAHLTTNAVLTIADMKTISGLGRRQVIPLLEMFDREGVTKREGDDRVRGPQHR